MHPYHDPLFCKFIVYFNENQDYFECHEVLEEYWKSIPGYTKDHPLTAFILLSTGMYHWRRGNLNGAVRTIQKATGKMLDFSQFDDAYLEELDYELLLKTSEQALQRLKEADNFTPFLIVPTSTRLKKLIENEAGQMQLLPAESDAVIHKHMLRDRSDILAEREKKKGRPD